MQTNFFHVFADTFTDGVHYALSPAVKIPDTWERARYVYVPIHDMQENVIGVCGFEINDLYFQLMNKAENDSADPIVYALLDNRSGTYSGQFSINQYGIADNAESGIRIYEKKGLSYFDFGTDTCVGKTCEVVIGGEGYLAAIMLPKDVFENRIRHGQFHAMVIILIMILTAFICCVVISRKYVSPILKKLEQVRSRGGDVSHLSIPEIDDLIDYLEARDIGYEQRLRDLESAKHAAEEEAARAKEAEMKKEARLQELAEIFADTIVEYIAIAAPEVAEIVGDEVCDPAEVRKMLDAMIPGLAAAAQLAKTLSDLEEKKGPTSKITTASPEGADSIVNFLKANGLA
jgi:hypothetical protein